VVVQGEPSGARFAVGEREQVIGRASDADLRLRDPRVSRQHAKVSLVAEGVRFECCGDASPILIDDVETRDGVAAVGQQVVVGETVLAVEAPSPAAGEATDVKTLLAGSASEVRGLSAIIALTEALDTAKSRLDVAPTLLAWGRRYATAIGVKLVEESPSREAVVTRRGEGDGSTFVAIPAHAVLGVTIEFELALPPERVTVGLLRLLAVAGRLCGSTLVRLEALEWSERERESLRELAIGSARAFLGESPAAGVVTRLVTRLAASDVVALLEGETGVGKTFVARLIHEAGDRAQAPLRVVNCAAIPENLIESELFGHERGAFTGATSARAGVFEGAGRGTVLLDEIGEVPLASQAKLLHVLEDKSVTRLGSQRRTPIAARLLAATNRDLSAMVEEGTFRRDLFFRLSVVRLPIPPLRERGEDLVLLAAHLLKDLSASSPRRVLGFSEEALGVIRRYAWPGNVRELRNVIEHALVLGDGERIAPEDLPAAVRAVAAAATPRDAAVGGPSAAPGGRKSVDLPASLEWLEKQAIEAALEATAGNQKQAAAILGINRVTLYKKLRAEKGE
jgi:DNA-binding NtrC family response regulator